MKLDYIYIYKDHITLLNFDLFVLKEMIFIQTKGYFGHWTWIGLIAENIKYLGVFGCRNIWPTWR